MFPERKKLHKMEKREEETFQVNHANTERLKKSSIPFMQRKLNETKNISEDNQNRKRKVKINLEVIDSRKRRRQASSFIFSLYV